LEGAYLAVARFRKAHGLKGDALFWVLTDEPERVFAVGRKLTPIDEVGNVVGDALEIERERSYHRNWLIKFREVPERGVLEGWDQILFGVPADELTPPSENEMYEHEIAGASVVVKGETVGTVRSLLDVPGGKLLLVDVSGRDVMVPFREPILVSVSRTARRIEIDPPPGLLDL
jgi:16S rRNA processing protein RimM